MLRIGVGERLLGMQRGLLHRPLRPPTMPGFMLGIRDPGPRKGPFASQG